jgi:hypothetical protein
VDDSGPLPVCAVDGIRIHPTRSGGWIHDAATTARLHREDVRRMVTELHVSETVTIRHEDLFGCPSCGSPDPAAIDTITGTCSDCWDRRKAVIDAAVMADER